MCWYAIIVDAQPGFQMPVEANSKDLATLLPYLSAGHNGLRQTSACEAGGSCMCGLPNPSSYFPRVPTSPWGDRVGCFGNDSAVSTPSASKSIASFAFKLLATSSSHLRSIDSGGLCASTTCELALNDGVPFHPERRRGSRFPLEVAQCIMPRSACAHFSQPYSVL